MTEEFKEKMEQQINRAITGFEAEYMRVWQLAEENPNKTNKRAATKMEMHLQIMELLYSVWETPIVYSQQQIGKLCPLVQRGRAEDYDFTRIVRASTETWRNYGSPILSRSNFSRGLLDVPPNEEAEEAAAAKAKKGIIGYWFARSDEQIAAYKKRTEHEALTTSRTRLANKRQEYRNLGVPDDNLDDAIDAIDRTLGTLAPNVIKLRLPKSVAVMLEQSAKS